MGKEYFNSHDPAILALGLESILGREPLEVARAVLNAARKRGTVELYVSGSGRMGLRHSGVQYADELPDIWLVGAYSENASTVHIMEDLQLRLAEVRAARG